MSPPEDSQSDSPQSLLARIDEVCDLFEQALAKDANARVEDLMQDWPAGEADLLLEHLLELELDYRVQNQSTIEPESYLARFPGCEAIVRKQLAQCGRPAPPSPLKGAAETHSLAGSTTGEFRGSLLPGSIVNERFRIVSKLGAGGMGEVFRADDLKLGQPVALKVLPEGEERNATRLELLLNEVKLARQVAHPNVCRVYDVGEYQGAHFLCMQFIDGEDLQSLIRRIGRLPVDKVLQLAHQLCSGLAAAHDNGVVHRDLKPANVMIDGWGNAKITDFGLARPVDGGQESSGPVGTPAYMAPEQYFDRETSVHSDLYALGLVLFEMLTGERGQPATTREELETMLAEGPPALVDSQPGDPDQDALFDAIRWCLQRDPTNRPPNALAISASLPGGDPLAIALGAGDTPSAGTVAAARDKQLLKPTAAWSILGAFVICLAICTGLWTDLGSRLGFQEAPLVLASKARESLKIGGGWRDQGAEAHGFAVDRDYLRYLVTNGIPWDTPQQHDPPLLYFWYRFSPLELAPRVPDWSGEAFLSVDENRPAFNKPGMVRLKSDMKGRLHEYHALPALEAAGDASVSLTPDWIHRATGRREIPKEDHWEAAKPRYPPRAFADEHHAWSKRGMFLDYPDVEGRTEAAALNRQLIQLQRIGPWSPDIDDVATAGKVAGRGGLRSWIMLGWLPILLIGGVLMARRNIRKERCDWRGARRVAQTMFVTSMVVWILRDAHVASATELDLLFNALAASLLVAAVVWCSYIALEPDARRFWPRTMIGWSRLVLGRATNARVGAEVLIGVAAGAAVGVLKLLNALAPLWVGVASDSFVQIINLAPLDGMRVALGELLTAGGLAVFYTVFAQLLFLLLLRITLRSDLRAGIGYVVFMSLLVASQHSQFALTLGLTAIEMSLTAYLFMRVGLLSVVLMHFVRLLIKWPLNLAPGFWGGDTALLAIGVAGILAAAGFYLSQRKPGQDRLAALGSRR